MDGILKTLWYDGNVLTQHLVDIFERSLESTPDNEDPHPSVTHFPAEDSSKRDAE